MDAASQQRDGFAGPAGAIVEGVGAVKRDTGGLIDGILLGHTGEHLAGELGFGVQADGQALAGVLLADVGVGQ